MAQNSIYLGKQNWGEGLDGQIACMAEEVTTIESLQAMGIERVGNTHVEARKKELNKKIKEFEELMKRADHRVRH